MRNGPGRRSWRRPTCSPSPAHDLTTELGIKERTITAVLNAKLIPIIGDFLSSVEHSMEQRGIKGQIMVYKGDGSLMNIAVARGRPVDTILSGPAASLMGGTDCSPSWITAIVLDIGGTSTDIAYLDLGFPRINREGASVGNWRTRVRAIDIWTSGLGGDSDMQVDRFGHLEIGPERVMPLAVASNIESGGAGQAPPDQTDDLARPTEPREVT